MLVSRHRSVDALGRVWEGAEVEGGAPAHFEVVRREVVVTKPKGDKISSGAL